MTTVLVMVLLPTMEKPPTLDNLHFTALAIKEIFVGVLIGCLCRIAFSTLESLSRLVRQAVSAHPETDTIFSNLYLGTGICAFLLMKGHHLFIKGFATTIKCISPHSFFSLSSSPIMQTELVMLMSSSIAAAVTASIPIFASVLISDLVISLISKLLSDTTTSAMSAVRAVAAQLAIIACFVWSVKASMSLISRAMEKLLNCGMT